MRTSGAGSFNAASRASVAGAAIVPSASRPRAAPTPHGTVVRLQQFAQARDGRGVALVRQVGRGESCWTGLRLGSMPISSGESFADRT